MTETNDFTEALPHTQVRFAHNSERQLAKLLDFYGIEWQYEPTSFVLQRNRDGTPAQAFTPDFYLPAYDVYVEITTLNQKLVTKKNKKARRLVEQYPGVRIKVLYQRDYQGLLVKYGLEPPSQHRVDGDDGDGADGGFEGSSVGPFRGAIAFDHPASA